MVFFLEALMAEVVLQIYEVLNMQLQKLSLKKGELISWDQGFDANDKQVWGATKGGYIFIKK